MVDVSRGVLGKAEGPSWGRKEGWSWVLPGEGMPWVLPCASMLTVGCLLNIVTAYTPQKCLISIQVAGKEGRISFPEVKGFVGLRSGVSVLN